MGRFVYILQQQSGWSVCDVKALFQPVHLHISTIETAGQVTFLAEKQTGCI